MAYEVVMPYHLHMPSYFLETFTEYPYLMQLTLPGLFPGYLFLFPQGFLAGFFLLFQFLLV